MNSINNPNVSICIPVYEANGEGLKLLTKCLSSIEQQTYKNYEIVISDHSKDDIIKNFCEKRLDILPITYVRYYENYKNGPANTNNVIKYAKGKYIKLLFQDDFLKYEHSLKKMIEQIETSDKKWLAVSCDHCTLSTDTTYHNYKPLWNGLKTPATVDEYLSVMPNIGSPSLILYERNNALVFDEELIMYMDVDFYYSLTRMYNEPVIMDDILVTVRYWNGSISSTYGKKANISKEKKHISDKYKNE